MVNDFLFELGVEELPSGLVLPLAEALTNHLVASLNKAKIPYDTVRTFAAPRRLGVLISGMHSESPGQTIVRRGPALTAAYNAEGQPTPALSGFAKSCGVTVEELAVSKTDKGEWLVYESITAGLKTTELMPSLVAQALSALPISKPMRWGHGDIEFVRPVHWVVMLFGSTILPCDILGVSSGRHSRGHRFHAPEAIEINHPDDYESKLEEAFVIANFAKRRALIVQQIENAATQHNATALMPDELVDEVTSIVEWPETLVASFEREFLEVPSEALIASMQAHQKCFALKGADDHLLPYFVAVTNLHSKNPSQVIKGNEKVMRARLSDAAFFFGQDKKQPLSAQIARTANVVFQIKLGTLRDKATRVQQLMGSLAPLLNLDLSQAIRAAELSKCDLMTGMVGEFPELQGLMGYYYAKHDGEDIEVARALREQYLPRFAADSLPEAPLGMALSLADRLDTLVGIFALSQKPTGDKDPFKLRRHALASARLLVSNSAALNLSQLIANTLENYGAGLPANAPTAVAELHAFILERLQSWYHADGISNDIFQAVKAVQADWLYDFDKRVRALANFVTLPEAASLSAACKRVNNLLQHEQNTVMELPAVDESLFQEDAEKMLFVNLHAMEELVSPMYAACDYASIFTHLATLKEPVDAFFDNVMVMVEDTSIKMNRLSLLTRLKAVLQGAADISLLQAG